MDYTKNLPPAAGWFFEYANSGTWYPIGVTFRFKVRVEVVGFEDMAWDERWYCIRVYNDWSQETKLLTASMPMKEIRYSLHQEAIEVAARPTVPKSLCPTACSASEEVSTREVQLLESGILCVCENLIKNNKNPLTVIQELEYTDKTLYDELMDGLLLIQSKQIDGRNVTDLDHVVLDTIFHLNQTHEISAWAFCGESAYTLSDEESSSTGLFQLELYTGEELTITDLPPWYFFFGESMEVELS